jgi:hypothetical protein
MLRRHWLRYGPIAICLFGAALLFAGAALQNHYNNDSSAQFEKKNQSANSAIRNSARPGRLQLADRPKLDPDCPSGSVERCGLVAQQSMTRSTADMADASWVTVGLTGAGVVLLWLTLLATRGMLTEARRTTRAAEDTVTETRRIGEAQVRAYLTPKHVEVSLNNGCPMLHYSIANSGNSPALEIQVGASARMTTTWQVDFANRPGSSVSEGLGALSHGEMSGPRNLHVGSCILSDGERSQLPTTQVLTFVAWLRISFIDVFDTHRTEEFRFYISMLQPAEGRRVPMHPHHEFRFPDAVP